MDWAGVTSFEGSAVRGEQAWTRRGIAIGQMRSLPATIYKGNHFSNSTPVIVPSKDTDLSALWCYCSSAEFTRALRAINQKLSVDNGYVSKIHVDIEYLRKEAADRFPMGVLRAHSNAAQQWICHGHPCGLVVWDDDRKKLERTDSTVLQVVVARLLGYRWPGEIDRNMELADAQREWVERAKALYTFADEDGIVCILPSAASTLPTSECRGCYRPPGAMTGMTASAQAARRIRQRLPRRLAAQSILRRTLQAISPPPVHLAHLGRSQARRLPCAGQLPQAGRRRRQGPTPSGIAHLQLPG